MADDEDKTDEAVTKLPDDARDDLAEMPGTDSVDSESQDELIDEWEDESFPASDPPAHY